MHPPNSVAKTPCVNHILGTLDALVHQAKLVLLNIFALPPFFRWGGEELDVYKITKNLRNKVEANYL